MSIQANINQTLSVASFLAAQSPMAAARREKQAVKVAEQREDERVTKELTYAQEQYKSAIPGGEKGYKTAKEDRLTPSGEVDMEHLEKFGEKYISALDAYEKRFGVRTPLEGQMDAGEAGGEAYAESQYIKHARKDYEEKKAEKEADDRRIEEMVEEDEQIEQERERERALVDEKRRETAERPITDYMSQKGVADYQNAVFLATREARERQQQMRSQREALSEKAKEDRIAAYKLELERLSPTKKEDKE